MKLVPNPTTNKYYSHELIFTCINVFFLLHISIYILLMFIFLDKHVYMSILILCLYIGKYVSLYELIEYQKCSILYEIFHDVTLSKNSL